MNDDIVTIVGYVLIALICAWAVWFLTIHLRRNVQSGTAIDRTLSEVDKNDAPGMYFLQTFGYMLLIGASAAIGLGAAVALVWRVASLSE